MTKDPYLNPQPPPTPKTWSERKKELDFTAWNDVRNLANIGHKKTVDGRTQPLITFDESLRTGGDVIKVKILDHELSLGWVFPTVQGVDFIVSPEDQTLLVTPPVASVSEVVQMPVSNVAPTEQPAPPTVTGRRRRSPGSQAVAPPPPPPTS